MNFKTTVTTLLIAAMVAPSAAVAKAGRSFADDSKYMAKQLEDKESELAKAKQMLESGKKVEKDGSTLY